jgi:hypothetical protein
MLRWLPLLLALGAGCDPTTVHGALAFRGPTPSTWDFAPTSCSNGDTREFYGADLSDGAADVRLIQDPVVGWLVTIARHGDPAKPDALLGIHSSCARFDVSLEYDRCTRCGKNDTDEDDSTMSGHLDIDCSLAADTGVSGRIDFQYCDNPEEDP